MKHIELNLNRNLTKEQLYELTKLLFSLGVTISQIFADNAKGYKYCVSDGIYSGTGDCMEEAFKAFLDTITKPNVTYLSNNKKRKLNKILNRILFRKPKRCINY